LIVMTTCCFVGQNYTTMLSFHDFILTLHQQGLLENHAEGLMLADGNADRIIARAATKSTLSGRISRLSSSKRQLRRQQSSKRQVKKCRIKTAQQLDSPIVQTVLFALVLFDVIIVLGELILSNTMCECCSWDKYGHNQKSCYNHYWLKNDLKALAENTNCPAKALKAEFKRKYCVSEQHGDPHAHGADTYATTFLATTFPATTTGGHHGHDKKKAEHPACANKDSHGSGHNSHRRGLKESHGSGHKESHGSGHKESHGGGNGTSAKDGHGGHHSHFCKENKHIETIEAVFRVISIVILAILETHILLLMALLWGKFFKKWELVLDLFIITVSLTLDIIGPHISGDNDTVVIIVTWVVLFWRMVRIVHGAYVAAENSLKEGQQRHAKSLKKLLGSISHSKMLIEILQKRLASEKEGKKAEKRTENAVDLIEINLSPRSNQLIQQILQEEEKVAAAAVTSTDISDSIDSVHDMVRGHEIKLERTIQGIMNRLHLTATDIKSKKSMIQLGLRHRRESRGATIEPPTQSMGPEQRV